MAGLVAGYELKRAGHIPVILEAQHRVGGRIYTLRDPFTEGCTLRRAQCASTSPGNTLYHAWIQGAIESGLRTAISIHLLPYRTYTIE